MKVAFIWAFRKCNPLVSFCRLPFGSYSSVFEGQKIGSSTIVIGWRLIDQRSLHEYPL